MGTKSPRGGLCGALQAELGTWNLEASPPHLTLTSSAPLSCHHHSPSATSPPGPGGAGRISWSPGCLDRLTSAGTGNAGPSGAPPATGTAKLSSCNPWAALICLHWRFDRGQEGFAMQGQQRHRGKPFPAALTWVVQPL